MSGQRDSVQTRGQRTGHPQKLLARTLVVATSVIMPSLFHNAWAELLRQQPTLLTQLLRDLFAIPLPDDLQTRLVDTQFTVLKPLQLQADVVVEVCDGDRPPALVIVAEVQQDIDPMKPWTWPTYLILARLRSHCDACVVVLTPSSRVAKWATKAIRLGPGNPGFRVLVIGPDQLPPLHTPEVAARAPARAVLTWLAHRGDPGGLPVLWAILEALPILDKTNVPVYLRLIDQTLGPALREALRRQISTMQHLRDVPLPPMFQTFVDQGRAEGEARGEARALLAVLAHRGIRLSAAQEEHVTTCTDLARLDQWLARSLAGEADLFTDS